MPFPSSSTGDGLVRILLISGSTRARSTNTAFVRTAALCAPPGVTTARHGMTGLPYFNPDDDRDPPPPAVAALRHSIRASQGVLFCTPEYAGSMPGALKNLLDWTVGGEVFTDLPTAWVDVAADPRRGGGADAQLAEVLGYVQARVVTEACRRIAVPRDVVGPSDGLVADPATRAQITDVLATLAAAAHVRAGH